jgi:hypothetical protein
MSTVALQIRNRIQDGDSHSFTSLQVVLEYIRLPERTRTLLVHLLVQIEDSSTTPLTTTKKGLPNVLPIFHRLVSTCCYVAQAVRVNSGITHLTNKTAMPLHYVYPRCDEIVDVFELSLVVGCVAQCGVQDEVSHDGCTFNIEFNWCDDQCAD